MSHSSWDKDRARICMHRVLAKTTAHSEANNGEVPDPAVAMPSKQLVSGTATMQLLSCITVLFPESSSTALKPLPSARLSDPHGALLDR